MYFIYYAWVLRHISQSFKIFVPDELIMLIIESIRLKIFEYNDTIIDIDYITPGHRSILQHHNSTLLLTTHTFKSTKDMSLMFVNDRFNSPYVVFYLDNQDACVSLKNFITWIDNIMQSDKFKEQSFFGRWIKYTYLSCISPAVVNNSSELNFDKITMYLTKEIAKKKNIKKNITRLNFSLTFKLGLWSVPVGTEMKYGLRLCIKTIKFPSRSKCK